MKVRRENTCRLRFKRRKSEGSVECWEEFVASAMGGSIAAIRVFAAVYNREGAQTDTWVSGR